MKEPRPEDYEDPQDYVQALVAFDDEQGGFTEAFLREWEGDCGPGSSHCDLVTPCACYFKSKLERGE